MNTNSIYFFSVTKTNCCYFSLDYDGDEGKRDWIIRDGDDGGSNSHNDYKQQIWRQRQFIFLISHLLSIRL